MCGMFTLTMNDWMCGYLMMLCDKKSIPTCFYILALLVTHLTTAAYKWQRGLWNAASIWRWMFSASAHGLICLASASLTSWHVPWGFLYRAGVLYLEPDLCTNTHTTGEDAMSVLFPRRNCQQYNHLPTLQCAFKDSIQKQQENKSHESKWKF